MGVGREEHGGSQLRLAGPGLTGRRESGQGEGSWVRAVTPMLVLEVPLTRCGLRRLSTPQWPTCPLVVGSHNAERDASPGGSGQQRTHDRLQE